MQAQPEKTQTLVTSLSLDEDLARVLEGSNQRSRELVTGAWNVLANWAGDGAEGLMRVRPQVLGVLGILTHLSMDGETLAVAVLRVGIRYGLGSVEDLTGQVDPVLARLVEGVSRMDRIPGFQDPEPGAEAERARLEGLRKLLLAMAEDLRVVIVKLAERLQEMRCLTREEDDGRRRAVAKETMDIFAPLANRLGIWQIKWELEDLAFRFLEPERYQAIAGQVDERRQDRERYIGDVVRQLKEALKREGIHADVSGRPKHIYSIWRKMRRKGVDFANLFDVRAVRVLTDNVKDCYAALGVVHGLWQHIPREFDDYITHPKGNNYRSLHTAVVGPAGRTLEVQIRTREMHRDAELGVAAHWRYKEGGRSDQGFEGKIAWLRQLLEQREESGDGGDFLDRFKTEVFHDRVYAVSPQGRVVDLPRGATPLDFAYAIHSEVGNRCRGAKVGGVMVPLTYKLKNGDQVEILTARNGSPSRDWLNLGLGYLKTPRARAKARLWFKHQDQEKNLSAGREILEKELRRLGVSEVNLDKLARRMKFDTLNDLFSSVGRGDVGSGQIAMGVRDELLPAPPEAPVIRKPARLDSARSDVTVEGVGNLLTHMARCCKPAPPDPIVGYITRGHGVTIHRQDCPNLLRLGMEQRSRLIDVNWGRERGSVYPVDVSIEAYDRKGLLRDITLLLANEKVNVVGVTTYSDKDTSMAHMNITVEVPDVGVLSRILNRLGQLRNVIAVQRRT